jgi:hypothetical protein
VCFVCFACVVFVTCPCSFVCLLCYACVVCLVYFFCLVYLVGYYRYFGCNDNFLDMFEILIVLMSTLYE